MFNLLKYITIYLRPGGTWASADFFPGEGPKTYYLPKKCLKTYYFHSKKSKNIQFWPAKGG